MQPPPFRIVSGLEHTSHGAMALALAGEFSDVDVASVEQALEGLADLLGPATDDSADARLHAVGALLEGEIVACRPRGDGGPRRSPLRTASRYPDAGHAVVCALVAVEAARLAGLHLGLVASGDAVYVADERSNGPWLLSPGQAWRVVDGRALGDPELSWQCPHEAAGIVLGMMLARTQRIGLLGAALRAAELCLALPVGAEAEHRLRLQLTAVRARLN